MRTWGGLDLSEATPQRPEDFRTWEDAIPPEERLGGPSEWGNSRWKVFQQCPWKYSVYYEKRLRPTVVHPRFEALMHNLWVGGLYHEARARYYLRHLDFIDAKGVRLVDVSQAEIDEACVQAACRILDLAAEVQPYVATEARRLVTGWLTLHGPGTIHDDRGNTMYVEELLATEKDGFPYTCRLDRVFWDATAGAAVIQEHKTASFHSETLLASYRTDPQILGQMYLWSATRMERKHGPLARLEVDIAVKKGQREYHRHAVPIAPATILRDWVHSMKAEWAALQACKASKLWPRRRANCFLWARACELQEVCAEHAANSKPKLWCGWGVKK